MIESIFNKVLLSPSVVAASSKGNPVISIAVVMLFYIFMACIKISIEELVFGENFAHWLDPIIVALFMFYSGWCVWHCAIFNASKDT